MEMYNSKDGQFINADCLDAMRDIPDSSVDMILCDLPYGTTQNKWDSIIPLEPLWTEYWRICKGAIVLTAAQPFTSKLVISEIDNFKYDWVWQKEKGTGHLNAKKMPMRDKEDICVFYKNQPTYNPQMTAGKPFDASKRGEKLNTENYGSYGQKRTNNSGTRHPKQIIQFISVGSKAIHPTQKPVALFEYLIKTYTNEGDTVLDNCAGSGTTAIAAINTNRKWICIEKDAEYSRLAVERIKAHHKPVDMFGGL